MSERLAIDADWQRVSPKYVWVVFVRWLVVGVIVTGASVLIAWSSGWQWMWAVAAVAAAASIVQLLLAPRRARAIAYLLRDDDLLVRKGIAWLRFVAVPYGRMQLVDISRGPVSRVLGLSELRFVTASASSDVEVPGLPEALAIELRDRLVGLAESRRGGL